MNKKEIDVLKFSDKNFDRPPSTNRGVDNTLFLSNLLEYQGFANDLGQFILFDWFQCTILSESFDVDYDTGVVLGPTNTSYRVIDMFRDLFGVESNQLVFEYTGVSGYNCTYSYKDIKIMYNIQKPEMGINILMSGQGCRCFEELKLDYIEFFKKLKRYSLINYNRIDISIDDFTNKYFTLGKIKKYINKGAVCSKFLTSMNIEKTLISNSESVGHTIQFGSKASNVQVTFYDKLKERKSKNIIVNDEVKYWTRCELRFRHETAKTLLDVILRNSNNINFVVKAILKEYINFKDLNSKDSNKSRRVNASWWDNYLENVENLKITNYLPESTITKKKDWLYRSTSKSQLMVFLSGLDNIAIGELETSYIVDLFQSGIEKIREKDIKMINSERIKNKKEPLTSSEIKAYIDSLHDYIVNKDNL